MKNVKFISFICLLSFQVQAQTDDELIKKHEDHAAELSKNLDFINESIKKNEKIVEELAEKADALKNYQSRMNANVTEFQNQVNHYLDNNSSVLNRLGSTNSFYRCLRNEINNKREYVKIDNCIRSYEKKISSEHIAEAEKWKMKIGLDLKSVEALYVGNDRIYADRKSHLEREIKNRKFISNEMMNAQDAAQFLRIKKSEQNILNRYPHIQSCDVNTPEVNLENETPYPGATFKGPFVGVPRDNQDGLGTCYANAAKNLIVSGSGGEDVASFLDLAIVYKGESGLAGDGLDAGRSCEVIRKTADQGYCPQKYAPAETGDKNSYLEGLFGEKKNTVWDQSTINEMVGDFLTSKNNLQNSNSEVSLEVFSRMKHIVRLIRLNPSIKFPSPIISHKLPSDRTLLSAVERYKEQKKNNYVYVIQNDYSKHYELFQNRFLRAAVTGKSANEILAIYDEVMKPFFDKYELAEHLPQWKDEFRRKIEPELSNRNLVGQLKQNVSFLKKILKKEDQSDVEFLEYCETFGHSLLSFAGSLKPLIEHLVEIGGRADLLADEDGKLRSGVDIMQLAVAPACINAEARKKLKHNFYCEDSREKITQLKNMKVPEKQKIEKMRETVVKSLVQGYAVGNTFQRHINSIVGMRYNAESRECEYLIRESQDGRSKWQSERRIYSLVEALTEVRKK